jgi:hypothetical protein
LASASLTGQRQKERVISKKLNIILRIFFITVHYNDCSVILELINFEKMLFDELLKFQNTLSKKRTVKNVISLVYYKG